ncbi:HEPN domain-containing protein [Psychromonas sp. PT13]|uniref:HEPN domain-containing protein n=1 Tax=Psychromonas sp. PT13 TaxID=3439547 RepID=UPI003EBECFBB
MMGSSEILSTKSYEVDVRVQYEDEVYMGKLSFSPDVKRLIISAELTGERKFNLPSELKKLVCDDFEYQYILSNLISNGSGVTHMSQSHTHCKVEYEFDSLFKYTHFEEPKISRIEIQSEELKSWITYTTKQQSLMLGNKQPNHDDLVEFCATIDDVGAFTLFYDYQHNSSHEEYFKGVSFLPTLRLTFDTPCNYLEAIEYVNNTLILMGVLIGGDFRANKVCTFSACGSEGYFYIDSLGLPTASSVFFPQSKNQHPLSGLDIPVLSDDVFSTYFKLVSEGSDVWKRYIKYKKMASTEERFLGFFRLLEKLTYQKDCYMDQDRLEKYLEEIKDTVKDDLGITGKVCRNLFNAIKYGNQNKLNTEACIQRFINKIDDFDDIDCRFNKKSDIGILVKLRNDITHANTMSLNDNQVECLTQFTEMLLVLALLLEIGIPLEDSSKVIHRLGGMHLIQR